MASRHFRSVIRNSSLSYRPELDGLRAIAITAVVLCHLELFSYGPYGVDFFFVLSGYLITTVLLNLRDKRKGLKIFWVGRIARLFPILFIHIIVGSILSYIFLRSTFQISQPLSALLYVKNFFILSPLNHDVWAPTWTLAAEEQFYLVWPLFIFFIAKRIPTKTIILIVVAYFLGIHFVLDFMNYLFGYLNSGSMVSADLAGKVVQVVIRPSEILLGALITLSRSISRPLIALYFASAFFLALYLGIHPTTTVALLSATVLSLLNLSAWPSYLLRRILSFKPLAIIGILSYSIYLWHALIFELIFVNFGKSVLAKLIIVVLTIIISYLSYVYIEIPVQKIIKVRTSRWLKA